MLRIALLAGLLSTSISLNLSAQRITRTLDDASPGIYHTSSIHTGDLSAVEKSYIVQFEGPPRLAREEYSNKYAGEGNNSIHARFESELAQIASTMRLSEAEAEIREVYSLVFNGALIVASEGILSEVRKLPYVTHVVEDGIMTAATRSIVPIDTRNGSEEYDLLPVKREGEFTGAGVVIAVIDSGVDYTHPDLVGGYLGGYDFVNEDADPMDDHGHGTHVAGIVAGNGTAFKGTAPDVQFLALKVLDASGKGFDSSVIRAIEHAVNPDGDPGTQDAVDIINLSISSLDIGMADHPVTIAVENATAAGVVCVVAAGNRGEEGRASITAPGNAISAITVGAMDQYEEVASFSSQGPSGSISAFSQPFFGLKPDLLAPGVQIRSTWLDGQYEYRDGTSMASPYVAGWVARVMQQFPEWEPRTIKAHLMQQTRDVGDSIWAQGAGMVDGSAQLPFVVEPACMDFGLVYSSQARWERSEVLTITNFGTVASTFEIRVRDSLPDGIQTVLSSNSRTLLPGESSNIHIDISANPRMLPSSPFPDGYVGYVDITSVTGALSIPFSVFKTHASHIQLSERADHVVLQSHAPDKAHIYIDAPNLSSLFVHPDTYDVMVQFENGLYTILKEDIELNEAAYTEINKEEAVLPVTIRAVDISGNALSPLAYEASLQGHGFNWLVSNYMDLSESNSVPTLHISPMSDAYSVVYNVTAFSETNEYYEIPIALPADLSGSVLLENEPAELKRFQYRYSIPEGVTEAFFVPWNTKPFTGPQLKSLDLSGFSHPGYLLAPPYEKNFYTSFIPRREEMTMEFGHSIVIPIPGAGPRLRDQQTLLRSAPMVVRRDQAMLNVEKGGRPLQEADGGNYELPLGNRGGYWDGELDNSTTRVRIKGPQSGGLFRGKWDEAFKSSGEWVLLKDGTIIDYEAVHYQPNVLPEDDPIAVERIVEPGAYTLIVRNETFLADTGQKGHSVELSFRTDRADPDPPRINRLYGSLSQNGEEELIIDLIDVCNWCTRDAAREHLGEVQLFLKRTVHDDWIEQPLILQDTLLIASFNGAYSGDYFALRVWAEDEFGNSMDYYSVDESGHTISDPRSVGLEDQSSHPADLSVSALYPNPSPGPVRFSYFLPDPADIQIFVYDMVGRRVMQIEEHQAAGMHEHLLDFNPFASGLYTIQLRVGEYSMVRQVLKIQ